MKNFIFTIYTFIIIFFSSLASSADLAGKIIMARGEVQAINESGVIRTLKRRDSIFSHEIIKTGKSSRVQIRFIDNALLALKENSELSIKSYVYNEVKNNDNQVLMELLTGGFRTLTGKIGKGNKEAYKVKTPVASIGIRGTLYDIQIAADKIYAGVWKGGIALKTQQGDFDLGINANFDFAEISATGGFTGLLTPPESLTPPSEIQEESPDKKETEGKSDDSSKAPAANKNERTTSSPKQQSQQETSQEQSIQKQEPQDQPSQEHSFQEHRFQDQAPQEQMPQEQSFQDNNQQPSQQPNEIVAIPESDTTSIPSPLEREAVPDQEQVQEDENFKLSDDSEQDNPNTINDPPLPTEGYTPDLRLSPKEFVQLSGNPKAALILGLPKLTLGVSLNTNGDGDRFFLSPTSQADGTSGYDIIRRNTSIEKDLTDIRPWSDQVSWGIWQGTSESPIQSFTRFNNDQYFEPIMNDLFYMEFNPATALEVQNGLVDGNFFFSTSHASLMETGETDYIANASNGGQVTNINAHFDLSANAQSYTINNAYLDIDVDMTGNNLPDQIWNLSSSSGQVNGSTININNLQGYLTHIHAEQQEQATGVLNGFLLSPKEGTTIIDTFAGGFEVSTINGSEQVGGVLILKTDQGTHTASQP